MNRQAGVTLIELAVTIAVLAILCALSTPNMIAWRNQARINGAAMEVLSIFQGARMEAVKRNSKVWVYFDDRADRYLIHVDDGTGGSRGDGVQDEGETVTEGRMPAGISVASVTRSPVDFNSRGIAHFGTTITLSDNGGRRRRVVVSPSGHSRIGF